MAENTDKDPLRFVKRHYEAAVKHSCDGKLAAAVDQLCYAMEEVIRWGEALQEKTGIRVKVLNDK